MVVRDLHLPRLDGTSVMNELQSNPAYAEIPIVVVAGSDVDAAVAQASAFLRKPCAPDLLHSVIEQHLDSAA